MTRLAVVLLITTCSTQARSYPIDHREHGGCGHASLGQYHGRYEIWQVVTFLHHLDNLPASVQQRLHRPAGSNP